MDLAMGMTARQEQEFMRAVEEMQMRDSMRSFNRLVERCFSDCVTGFRSKTLESGEEKCVDKCVAKFMAHAQRVGARFGEYQYAMSQQQAKQE